MSLPSSSSAAVGGEWVLCNAVSRRAMSRVSFCKPVRGNRPTIHLFSGRGEDMLTYESILQPLPPRDRLSLFSSFLPECNLPPSLPPPGALWHALRRSDLAKNASRRVMGRDCYWAVTFHLTPFFRLFPLPNLRERILRGGGKKRQTRWK